MSTLLALALVLAGPRAWAEVSHSCVYNCGGSSDSSSNSYGGWGSGSTPQEDDAARRAAAWARELERKAREKYLQGLHDDAKSAKTRADYTEAFADGQAIRSLEQAAAGNAEQTFDGLGNFLPLGKDSAGVPAIQATAPATHLANDAEKVAAFDAFMECLYAWRDRSPKQFDLPGLLLCVDKGAASIQIDRKQVVERIDAHLNDMFEVKGLRKSARDRILKTAGLPIKQLWEYRKPMLYAARSMEVFQLDMLSTFNDANTKIGGASKAEAEAKTKALLDEMASQGLDVATDFAASAAKASGAAAADAFFGETAGEPDPGWFFADPSAKETAARAPDENLAVFEELTGIRDDSLEILGKAAVGSALTLFPQ